MKTKSGLRYCPVVLAANGRIKPNYVLVDGKQEAHPEGAYYLEWRNGLHRVRVSVGKDVADAAAKRHRKEAELNAINSGVTVVSPDAQNGRRSFAATVADYLVEVKLTKKPKTHSAYSTALEYFQESCPKFCLEDVDRKDLLEFAAFLRDEKEQAQRSCWNKFSNVMTFLKAQGIRGLAGKNDWPRYTEEEPEVYEQEELDKLFAVCDAEERLWYEFFLMTGERANHVWSYDFVKAMTHDGRALRILVVIDEYTRECLALRVARRLGSLQVMDFRPTISFRCDSLRCSLHPTAPSRSH